MPYFVWLSTNVCSSRARSQVARWLPHWHKLRFLLHNTLEIQPDACTVCVVGIERRRVQAPRSGPFEHHRIMFFTATPCTQIIFRGRTYMSIRISRVHVDARSCTRCIGILVAPNGTQPLTIANEPNDEAGGYVRFQRTATIIRGKQLTRSQSTR